MYRSGLVSFIKGLPTFLNYLAPNVALYLTPFEIRIGILRVKAMIKFDILQK